MIYNTNRATASATRIQQSDYSNDVKKACLTALGTVGRLRWAGAVNDFNLLAPGKQLGTGRNGCVCYQAPILWAFMAGLIKSSDANRWFGLSLLPNGEQQVLNYIYDRCQRRIRAWTPGLQIPAGAMVFHGRSDNACAHVTLYIGNAEIVSCWGAQLSDITIQEARGAGSDELKLFREEIDELVHKQLVTTTTVIPVLSFSGAKALENKTAFLRYTEVPFWELW